MTKLHLQAGPYFPVGVAAAVFAIWYFASTINQYLRLRHFKGPTIAGLTQIWLIRCVGGGRTHLDLQDVCEKYGTVSYSFLLTFLVSLFRLTSSTRPYVDLVAQ